CGRVWQQRREVEAPDRALLDHRDEGAGEVGPDVAEPPADRRRGGAETAAAIPAAASAPAVAAARVIHSGQRRVERGLLAGQRDAGAVRLAAAEHEPPAAKPLVGLPALLRHPAPPAPRLR